MNKAKTGPGRLRGNLRARRAKLHKHALGVGSEVEARLKSPQEEEQRVIVRYQECTERNQLNELSAPKTVALVGVGGQGVSLAADILHEAAQLAGFDAALLEIYSIGRSGGSVRCQVTLSSQDASRPVDESPADVRMDDSIDYLVAFEMKAAMDLLEELHPQGTALVHRRWLDSKGRRDPATAGRWTRTDGRVVWLDDFQELEPGDEGEKTLPAYVLGALSRHLPIGDGAWREALAHHLPGKLYVEALEVFEAGASLAASVA